MEQQRDRLRVQPRRNLGPLPEKSLGFASVEVTDVEAAGVAGRAQASVGQAVDVLSD